MPNIVKTPKPPYYAVIFTSKRTEGDHGYSEMADCMSAAAETIEGYIGAESVRDANGFGMTISYWETLESIKQWQSHLGHLEAKRKGKDMWYSEYMLRICKVDKDHYFEPSLD